MWSHAPEARLEQDFDDIIIEKKVPKYYPIYGEKCGKDTTSCDLKRLKYTFLSETVILSEDIFIGSCYEILLRKYCNIYSLHSLERRGYILR